MTKKQFEEINTRLAKWREERHLTKDSQIKGYLGNVYEEISEFYRANNEYEKIDAIMDIVVFTLNAYDIDYKNTRNYKTIESISGVIDIINKKNIDYQIIKELERLTISYKFSFYDCMIETINEISSRTGYYDTKINKFIKDQGAYTLREASKYFTLSYLYKEDKDYWYFLTFGDIKKIKKWYKADYFKYKIY